MTGNPVNLCPANWNAQSYDGNGNDIAVIGNGNDIAALTKITFIGEIAKPRNFAHSECVGILLLLAKNRVEDLTGILKSVIIVRIGC